MIGFKIEIDGYTISDDFNGKGYYRTRLLFGKTHLAVQMNPEQSSFPIWVRHCSYPPKED